MWAFARSVWPCSAYTRRTKCHGGYHHGRVGLWASHCDDVSVRPPLPRARQCAGGRRRREALQRWHRLQFCRHYSWRGGEDKEEDAPQALYAGDDGKVFVLDQVNGRILHFDPANPTAPPQTLQLPPGLQPTDLVVKGDDIYVWDGTAHALKALGAADAPVRA